jgi:hypothetical protein
MISNNFGFPRGVKVCKVNLFSCLNGVRLRLVKLNDAERYTRNLLHQPHIRFVSIIKRTIPTLRKNLHQMGTSKRIPMEYPDTPL